jgi:hypothetical protein
MSGTVATEQNFYLFCVTCSLSISFYHWEELPLRILLEEFSNDIRRVANFDLGINVLSNGLLKY